MEIPEEIFDKAMTWLNANNVGKSSMTIWNCMLGVKIFPIHIPYDIDDFSRCYKLLEFIPEWKNKINNLSNLNLIWAKLAKNWDILTEMYLDILKSGYSTSKIRRANKFMQTLIR